MFIYVFLFKKMSNSLIPSFLMSDVSESLRWLTKNERCERIAQVPHQNWATMSNLLRLLTKNKQKWANMSESLRSLTKNEQMSESLVFWANRSFAHVLQNTSYSLGKPMREFPALHYSNFLRPGGPLMYIQSLFVESTYFRLVWLDNIFHKSTNFLTQNGDLALKLN